MLPRWLVVVLVAAASWLLLERLFMPSVRWFLRRRVNRVLEEVNQRLQINIQPFKLTKRRVLIDRLLFDPQVTEAAERLAAEEQFPRAVVMDRVERYAREIVPSFNALVYFRFGYWLSRRLARALYRVRLGSVDSAALESVPAGSTIVFVMNHRSNMDYILVSYLVAERTALSYAVGEWARRFPLEGLVRSMGAYFVRRRSRNPLYRRVLARYVAMATREGVTQAMYPEGRLSRDGRLGEAKLGLLDYMVRSFDPAGPRDVVFVPAGLNYDRVLEDRTLLLDTTDGRQRKRGLAAAWTTLAFWTKNLALWLQGKWYRFGYACVSFGRPVSLREYLEEAGVEVASLDRSQRFARVAELAGSLMDEVAAVIPVLPVSLVATCLSRAEGPVSRLELKAAVHSLMEEIQGAGGQIYLPRDDGDYAIDVGLRMLLLRRAVVDDEDAGLRVVPEERDLLAFYANSIAHLIDGADA